MVIRFVLNNWDNGNFSELDRKDLISLVRYFEECTEKGKEVASELIDESITEEE